MFFSKQLLHIVFLLSFLLFFGTVASGQKSIVVVFDDSGSMRNGQGSRCHAVSYAMQVLTAFLTDDDKLFVVKMSQPNRIVEIALDNRQQAIAGIENWSCSGSTPVQSVHTAMKHLDTMCGDDTWLIVFTDGEFESYSDIDRRAIEAFMQSGCAKVMLLNIDMPRGQFAQSLREMGVNDVYFASPGNNDIIGSMQKISTGIMTLPQSGMIPVSTDDKTVVLNSIFPLKRIIVLDQVNGGNTNSLAKAKSGSIDLDVSRSYQAKKDNLSSKITHILPGNQGIIDAGNIELTFREKAVTGNMKFLPLVAIELQTDIDGLFKSKTGNNYVVCADANTVSITAKLIDLDGKTISPELMSQSEILIHIEGKDLSMQFADSVFVLWLEINEAVKLSVSAKHSDYYYFRSNIYSLTKDDCPIVTLPETISYPSYEVSSLNNDSGITIQPLIDGVPISADQFDALKLRLVLNSDANFDVTQNGDSWHVKYRGNKCQCFAKTGKYPVEIELWSETQNRKLDTGQFNVEIKNVCFLKKCLWLILSILLIVFLIWYIIGLIRKRRFHKDYNLFVVTQSGRQPKQCRPEKIKTSFLAKWLLPYRDETFTLNQLIFKAGTRKNHIMLSMKTKQSISSGDTVFYDTMELDFKRDIQVSEGTAIELKYSGAKTTFFYIKKTDNTYYYDTKKTSRL